MSKKKKTAKWKEDECSGILNAHKTVKLHEYTITNLLNMHSSWRWQVNHLNGPNKRREQGKENALRTQRGNEAPL